MGIQGQSQGASLLVPFTLAHVTLRLSETSAGGGSWVRMFNLRRQKVLQQWHVAAGASSKQSRRVCRKFPNSETWRLNVDWKMKKSTCDILSFASGGIKDSDVKSWCWGSMTGLISSRLSVKCWQDVQAVLSDRQVGQQNSSGGKSGLEIKICDSSAL